MGLDLAVRGRKVEVSIRTPSDWATQGLGVWVDDIDVPATAPVRQRLEAGLGSWSVGDPTEIGQ